MNDDINTLIDLNKVAMEKEGAYDGMYGDPPQFPEDPVYMMAYHAAQKV